MTPSPHTPFFLRRRASHAGHGLSRSGSSSTGTRVLPSPFLREWNKPSQAPGGFAKLPAEGKESVINAWRAQVNIAPFAVVEQTCIFYAQSAQSAQLVPLAAPVPFRLLGHALDLSRLRHAAPRTRASTSSDAAQTRADTSFPVATSDAAAASAYGGGAGAAAAPQPRTAFISLATRVPAGHNPVSTTATTGRRHFPGAGGGALVDMQPAATSFSPSIIIVHGEHSSGDGAHAAPRIPLVSRLNQGVWGVVDGVASGLTAGLSGASSALQGVAHGASAAAASFAHAAARSATHSPIRHCSAPRSGTRSEGSSGGDENE